jgi:2-succinyl-5-enolpyruvyl-6-hydroxy-3-cyclohexene-1-carboxylate synthase
VQRLIDLGVKHAVLSPGSRNAPISLLLAQAEQQGLLTLHVRIDEREAAFLALGLSKLSGIPALLCCTSGTAAVNFAPAVAEAFYSQVPMIVLTADRPEGAAQRGDSQTIHQDQLYGANVLASFTIGTGADPQDAADRARVAWSAACGPQHGPVHVNLHFAEPLLASPAEWPTLRAAEPFGISQAAEVDSPPVQLPALGNRPVMVIGDIPQHERNVVQRALDFAASAGIPVLMEPTAGIRDARVAVRRHALITDALAADVTSVVTFGRFGLGRHLRRLCERTPVHVAFSAQGAGADPFATATLVLPLAEASKVLGASAEAATTEQTWLNSWRAADERATTRIAEVLQSTTYAPTGLQVAAEVLKCAADREALVFAAASRSIRDVDLMADFAGPKVVANLGVNGIDGLISTAAGAAAEQQRHTYLLIGDIAFLHGSNGLLKVAREAEAPLTVVVVDDNGGAIFSDLEQGADGFQPWFERVFGTPHDMNLVELAHGYGVDTTAVSRIEELRIALSNPQHKVVVVQAANRAQSRAVRAMLRE